MNPDDKQPPTIAPNQTGDYPTEVYSPQTAPTVDEQAKQPFNYQPKSEGDNPANSQNQPITDQAPTEKYQPNQAPTQEENTDSAPQDSKSNLPPETPISWSANEYLSFEKTPVWYVFFVIIALSLVALDIFVLKSWTFSALVIVMAIALLLYVRRPPAKIQYTLSPQQGLYIGERLYHLSDFRAFGFTKDSNANLVMLIPIKRFAPALSIYFPDEVGEKLIDILGQRLPMEDLKLDAVDKLLRKIKL